MLLTTLSFAPACGSDDDGQTGPREWVAGSRLSVLTRSFAGTEEVPTSYYDQELQTACFFREAADGALRCAPTTTATTGQFAYYASADCAPSSRLAFAYGCGHESQRFAIDDVDACPTQTRVFELGAPYTGSMYVSDGTECFPTGPQEGTTYYPLGDEIAPERMVAAERELVGGGRLKGHDFVAEDGARRPYFNYRDTDLGLDCYFGTAADGSFRCLPGDLYFDFGFLTFGDAACSQPAIDRDCSGDSPYAFSATEGWCGQRSSAYELGDPLGVNTLYFESDGECVEYGDAVGGVRPIGEEVPPSAMVEATLETRGSGRIRSQWEHTSVGEIFAGWWDSELETSCFVMPLADGGRVCVPSGGSTYLDEFTYYADPDCLAQLPVGVSQECEEARFVLSSSSDGCPLWDVYRVTGSVEGDLFRYDDEGTCRAATDAERAPLRAVERLDLDAFERATEPAAALLRATESSAALLGAPEPGPLGRPRAPAFGR